MKKQLFAVALLAGATLLSGCKGNTPDTPDTPDPEKDVTVVVSPRDVILTAEEPTIRLAATLTPADATATVEWTSSDTTVATVTNRGFVEAQGYGECYIYATVGKAKDSCHVKVQTYLESVVFNSAIVWNWDSLYNVDAEGKPKTIDYNGNKLYLVLAKLYVFSDGLYVNNSGYIDGTETGVILKLDAPMYLASKWLNNLDYNITYSIGEWIVNDTAHYSLECKPGKLDETEYMSQMKDFLAAYNENSSGSGWVQPLKNAAAAFEGPILDAIYYDDENEGYYSSNVVIPDAYVTDARIYLGFDEFPASQYMTKLDYSKITFRALAQDNVFGMNWGLNLSVDAADQIVLNDEEVHYLDDITSVYGDVPASAAAPRKLKANPARLIKDVHPELMEEIEKQIKEKNIRVISIK